MEKLFTAIKAAGLRKVLVGLYIFSVISILVGVQRLTDATYGQCVMALIAVLLPAMASEHFSKPKE